MGLFQSLFGTPKNNIVPAATPQADLKSTKAALVGTRYVCLFPKGIIGNRPRALSKSKLNDPVSLRVYEYEGAPAIAVINDRLGVDIGVIKKESVERILKILHDSNVNGKIIKLDCFYKDNDVKNGELIYTCTVQFFYAKRA